MASAHFDGSDTRGPYVPQKAFEFTAFNTINTVVVYGEDDFSPAFEAMQVTADHYERLFSHTNPNSALSRFNRLGGQPESIDSELAELIDLALAYSTETDGLFDPAFDDMQDKGNKDAKRPGEGAPLISSLGGIAKGYIADALCNLLKQHGVKHAIVNLGGNVKVFGGKPMASAPSFVVSAPGATGIIETVKESSDGTTTSYSEVVQPFTIGLRVPKKYSFGEDFFATVQISEGSVVTSGIYERGTHASDGTWQHHIIDPRTGMSADTDLVSASVISDSSVEADAYATALIVMGLERAREFIEQVPRCEAVFVATDGQVHVSSGMGTKVPFAC